MDTIRAKYEIVTPMFLGDATSNATAKSIRPPSVKGALRYWWRAIQWPRLRAATSSDEEALRELHGQESRLFGAAATDKGGGQSAFLLRVVSHHNQPTKQLDRQSGWLNYLLGQGLVEKNYLLREFIPPGGFEVRLIPSRRLDEAMKHQLGAALVAWGTLGGLGSRARKGFGSVALQTIDGCDWSVPQSTEDIASVLRALTGNAAAADGPLPPITAISGHSRIDCSVHGADPLSVLETVGRQMQLYRAWGYQHSTNEPHTINGQEAEQNFTNDHQDIKRLAQGRNRNPQLPQRAVFGLPHNYFFSSLSPYTNVTIEPGNEGRRRRASPLHIHIHRFPGSEHYCAIQSLLKSQFLASDAEIQFQVKRGNQSHDPQRVSAPPTDRMAWDKLTTYMDRFSERARLFPSRERE